MFFYKEGKIITIEQGFRWATFTVESDERPLTDDELKNENGYELSSIDNDESWEMWDMIDGCWVDIETGNDTTTSEDLEEFQTAWEEDSYEGVEALGWSQTDCEYYYFGPLELTNESTGQVFYGEPPSPAQAIDPDASVTHAELEELQELPAVPELTPEETEELLRELEAEIKEGRAKAAKWPFSTPSVEVAPALAPIVEDLELTDWYPASINPARRGTYQVLDTDVAEWPFPEPQPIEAKWSGKKWNLDNVLQWRGLAKDPKK